MNNSIVSKRIKETREKIGMSAEQLGEKVGKAKTTIYRYESGYIEKMPSTTLRKIADVLQVSPAYLMGWEDEKQIIHSKEQRLLDAFHRLIPTLQDYLIETAESLAAVEINVRKVE